MKINWVDKAYRMHKVEWLITISLEWSIND